MSAPQRSEAWFKEREGKLTASTFGQACGLGPGSRQQLWRKMMGLEPAFEGNSATDWGTESEPKALQAYASSRIVDIETVGFIAHPELKWLGGSPDLLADNDGMGEIKCPFGQEIYPDVPAYYMAQMQGLMEITGRAWCDFIVWTPQRMSVRRITRSTEYWRWMHLQLAQFWMYYQAQCEPPRMKRETPPNISLHTGKEIITHFH